MKNLSKKIIYIFVLVFILNSCGSLKDGLSGAKQKNTDEFLVQKKNPLVLPPNYNELPKPKIRIKKTSEEKDFDIMSILGNVSAEKKKTTKIKTMDSSTKKQILEKINKN